MKNTRFTSMLSSSLIACALTIGSLASTQSALAQSGETPLGKVNIPFAFQTATKTMPAGTYRIALESNHTVVLLSSGRGGTFVMMNPAIRSHAAQQGTMVFDHYGNKYYLRQIWTARSTDGLE